MNLTYEQLIKDMSDCEQTKGMSVLEHGRLVNDYYMDLLHHLTTGHPLRHQWKLPTWIEQYGHEILTHVFDSQTVTRYQIHHDCGKPYCRCVDEEGKVHFPDHANVSARIWSDLYPHDSVVTKLIKSDMLIHELKGEGVSEFIKRADAVSLLITGFSEIHANASMFGGIDSTSFKIKWKQIDRRGKAIVENLAIQ